MSYIASTSSTRSTDIRDYSAEPFPPTKVAIHPSHHGLESNLNEADTALSPMTVSPDQHISLVSSASADQPKETMLSCHVALPHPDQHSNLSPALNLSPNLPITGE